MTVRSVNNKQYLQQHMSAGEFVSELDIVPLDSAAIIISTTFAPADVHLKRSPAVMTLFSLFQCWNICFGYVKPHLCQTVEC